MLHLLLIPLGDSPLPKWTLPNFHVERASSADAALRSLNNGHCDVVVVVARHGSSGVQELCANIEAACGADVVPLALAADSRDQSTHACLETLQFDGLIDLQWDELLIEQCLNLVVARVKSGRGVAAIQQQVLRAVRQEVAELKHLSVRDETTGLFNVRHYRDVIEREHKRCERHRRSYAIAAFDLDNLRAINNQYGHAAGTRALSRVGMALAATTRDADYSFRVGGDEFVSLLVESSADAAKTHAERICQALRRCVLTEASDRIPLSTSVGVAVYPDDGSTVEEVQKAADAALYAAKSQGRDRVVVHAAKKEQTNVSVERGAHAAV